MVHTLRTPSTYNELHTEFVTTQDGIKLMELLYVLGSISLTPLLVPLLLPWIVPPSFVKQAVYSSEFYALIRVIVEYPFLIVLPIWIVTVFSGEPSKTWSTVDFSGIVFVSILFIPLMIVVANHAITMPKWLGFRKHWDNIKDLPTGWTKKETQEEEKGKEEGHKNSTNVQTSEISSVKLPFLTNYRAIVNYITILCILAVDFPVFPRRFAKTKAYGISLMDVGTGCFVFSNGIVAPEARNRKSSLSKSLKSFIPIIILGFVRLLTVKGIEYQEVVEEYGVHWNFFFTLAGVKILSSLLFTFFNAGKSLCVAIIVGAIYEAFLNLNDFQNQFILNPDIPRDANLLAANREGVFSVFGYLVIYLSSVYFGKVIYCKQRVSVAEWFDYSFQSFLQVSILWIGYAISTGFGSPPCRRSANLSYILLMVALNYTLLWGQVFLGFLQVCLQHLGLIFGPILFYKMAAYQNQSHLYVHQQTMDADYYKQKRKAREAAKDAKNKKMDQKLDELEEAIEIFKNEKLKGEIEQETIEKLKALEDEIQALESELEQSGSSQSENEEIPKINTTTFNRRSLVLLPDLSKAPIILESICYNGLFVFLLGNLLTGLINCMIYTMYTPVYLSLCYLWLYATVIAACSVALYWYKIQLKFW